MIKFLIRCVCPFSWEFLCAEEAGFMDPALFTRAWFVVSQNLSGLTRPLLRFFFRHNVVAVHALLTRFARGDFADGKADFAWTLQVRRMSTQTSLRVGRQTHLALVFLALLPRLLFFSV